MIASATNKTLITKEEFHMKRFTVIGAFLISLSWSAHADGNSITYYSDGALIEFTDIAGKGIITVPLLDGMIENSLRIKPATGTAIQRVEVLSVPSTSQKTGKDTENLQEQRNRLNDRLQALATREAIFTAAAKSQSGKAPRKSKSNPDPLQSIRQGTDFAIAQLEAVYTARRKTEQEIRRLDSRLDAAGKNGRGMGKTARITVSPPQGRVTARYAVAAPSWTPRYDISLNGTGTARLDLYGQLPESLPGYRCFATLGTIAESTAATGAPVPSGSRTLLARYNVPVYEQFFGSGAVSPFSFVLKNTSGTHLPTGEASIFRGGDYYGKLRFEGISSGRNNTITSGK